MINYDCIESLHLPTRRQIRGGEQQISTQHTNLRDSENTHEVREYASANIRTQCEDTHEVRKSVYSRPLTAEDMGRTLRGMYQRKVNVPAPNSPYYNADADEPRFITLGDFVKIKKSLRTQEIAIREANQRHDEAEVKRLKMECPILLFNAAGMQGDKSRCDENALPSGNAFLDLDKTPERGAYIYRDKIRGREKELGIVYAEESLSGYLHCVIARREGESIAAAATRVARAIGMEQYLDTTTFNISRASFMTSTMLYIDIDAMTWNPALNFADAIAVAQKFSAGGVSAGAPAEQQISLHNTNLRDSENTRQRTYASANIREAKIRTQCEDTHAVREYASANLRDSENTRSENTRSDSVVYRCGEDMDTLPTVAGWEEYEHVPMRKLIDEDIKRITKTGEVKTGNRNDTYFNLIRDFRHIIHDDKSLFDAIPNFGLPQDEVESAFRSAKSDKYVQIYRPFETLLRSLIEEAALERGEELKPNDIVTPVRPELPLPKPLQWATDRLSFSPDLTDATLYALLVAYATVAPYRFNYWFDEEEHSFALNALITGTPASGKSYIMKAVEAMLLPVRENDAKAEREREEEEEKIRLGLADSERKQKTARRIVQSYTSRGEMLKLMREAKNQRVIQVTSEFAEIINNNSKEYSAPTQVYNKSFDSDFVGAGFCDSKYSAATTRATVNVCATGTPSCLDYLRSHIDDGLASRFVIYRLTDCIKVDKIRGYTAAEKMQLRTFTASLLAKPVRHIHCPWADKAARSWWHQIDELQKETGSPTIDYFHNRDCVMLARIIYLLSVLYGCEEYSDVIPAGVSPETTNPAAGAAAEQQAGAAAEQQISMHNAQTKAKKEDDGFGCLLNLDDLTSCDIFGENEDNTSKKEDLSSDKNDGLTTEQKQEAAVQWGVYLVDKLLNSQYNEFADLLENQVDATPMPPKCTNVYAALPEEFTPKQFCAISGKDALNYSRIIRKWQADNWIEKTSYGHYRKLHRN